MKRGSPGSSDQTDKTVTTLIIENLTDTTITKAQIVPALGKGAAEVVSISLNPLKLCATLQFKTWRAAQRCFQENLGCLTITGKKYRLNWDLNQKNAAYVIPPPPPDVFPKPESFGRTQSQGVGRGTYDPQFRQMGHFMDTAQLVEGPSSRTKKARIEGMHKKKA